MVLDELHFDPLQFAYLRNRSTTEAILVLTELIKKPMIDGYKTGAVFFDFADAFGSVDRTCLVYKIGHDFNISGRLLLHISSFLSDRLARIRFGGENGSWIESEWGTSAGTKLGPLLFIMYLHDIPKSIFPKFADDIVSVKSGSCCSEIENSLQHTINELVDWSKDWGMVLNCEKTKCMLFGGSKGDCLNLMIESSLVEEVSQQIYLGVMLDQRLTFSPQVDYAVSKAQRATYKLSGLMKSGEGIPVQLGITLFKTLVRSHLEYAIPAWAAIGDKEVTRLEKVQSDCLSMVIGAKAKSSIAAMEVVTGVIPFRIRIRELCTREFCRIMSKDNDHILRKLVEQSTRKGLQFCPLEYMRIMSKQLLSTIGECQIVNDSSNRCCLQSKRSGNVSRLDIVCRGGDHANRHLEDEVRVVKDFVFKMSGKSVLIFTDGSVLCSQKKSVGPGACAAIMCPLQGDGVESMFTRAVSNNTDIVSCEVEGIILGMEKVVEYYSATTYRESDEVLYILCDSVLNAQLSVFWRANLNVTMH